MFNNEPPQNTFVIRFWWELPKGEPPHTRRWRGRIEHLQSGQTLAFDDTKQVLAFISHFLPVMETARTHRDGDK